MPRLRQIALRPQDRLPCVRALHKPRTQFIEASSPTHSSPVAPFSFVGPCASAPPRHLPRHPLHFHGQIFEVSGILTGECDVIQGVGKQLMAQHSKTSVKHTSEPLPLPNLLCRLRPLRKPRTHFI